MMCQIIESLFEYPLKNYKILLCSGYSCGACAWGNLIVRPSFTKVIPESPTCLEKIHEDICKHIHLPCESIYYFMVSIDVFEKSKVH